MLNQPSSMSESVDPGGVLPASEKTALLENQQKSAEFAEQELDQYLTFYTAQRRFAVSILEVEEIIEVSNMTRVPMAADFIRGVINVRGRVVAVVDLSARLVGPPAELSKRSSIVLLDVPQGEEHQTLGILVDAVAEIIELSPDQRQAPPDFGTEIRSEFIQCMGRIGDDFLIVLDTQQVLSVDELARIQSIPPNQSSESLVDAKDSPTARR